jgi:AbrB family looped-hinge helix DNA binding protein
VTRTEVEVNPQGRVTIPAPLRAELGLTPGSRVVAYIEDGRLVLEDRGHLLARIQEQVLQVAAEHGHTGSAVDEFLADRRAEAAREDRRP